MTRDNVVDASTGLVAFGAFAEILPPVAAALAIILAVIRIYEWGRVRLWGKPPTKFTD